jgi:hypothetical protein
MKSTNAFLVIITLILACSSGSQINPHVGKMIVPGQGTDEIRVGMNRAQVIGLLGQPETSQEDGKWLSYQDGHGLAFRFGNLDRVAEIHFSEGFKGRLPSRIQIGSKTQDVFQAHGSPAERREVPTGLEGSKDRILYMTPEGYRITYRRLGLAFWFSPAKRVTRIVVFRPMPDRRIRIKPDEGQAEE